uniref:E3 ubiquitin-protein ligase ZNRF1 n=1 Tax=Ditylenchus dipsaci TaxID=166011 RepID=A0A915DD50_9BILA
MGARQSIQGDIDRRPRSNSTIETGVEVHGTTGRRPISHYHREASSTSDLDEDADNVAAGLASLGISSALSSSTSSSPTVVNSRNNGNTVSGSAPSPSHHNTHYRHSNSSGVGHSASNSGGLRFSFRPTNRTSFLQALAGGNASTSTSSTGRDIKCPICHKKVPSDDVEVHLVMCFTRPKIAYNDDVLENEKGECAICLEDMSPGETIARLPCLCIYHKTCIDEWFKRKNCCPEHPGEED